MYVEKKSVLVQAGYLIRNNLKDNPRNLGKHENGNKQQTLRKSIMYSDRLAGVLAWPSRNDLSSSKVPISLPNASRYAIQATAKISEDTRSRENSSRMTCKD